MLVLFYFLYNFEYEVLISKNKEYIICNIVNKVFILVNICL